MQVNLTNDQTGHLVPTDSPLRHLILLVRAEDEQGQRLTQLDGPRLPDWCGVGDATRRPLCRLGGGGLCQGAG